MSMRRIPRVSTHGSRTPRGMRPRVRRACHLVCVWSAIASAYVLRLELRAASWVRSCYRCGGEAEAGQTSLSRSMVRRITIMLSLSRR